MSNFKNSRPDLTSRGDTCDTKEACGDQRVLASPASGGGDAGLSDYDLLVFLSVPGFEHLEADFLLCVTRHYAAGDRCYMCRLPYTRVGDLQRHLLLASWEPENKCSFFYQYAYKEMMRVVTKAKEEPRCSSPQPGCSGLHRKRTREMADLSSSSSSEDDSTSDSSDYSDYSDYSDDLRFSDSSTDGSSDKDDIDVVMPGCKRQRKTKHLEPELVRQELKQKRRNAESASEMRRRRRRRKKAKVNRRNDKLALRLAQQFDD